MSEQLLCSGTAIGALASESRFVQCRVDFINKMDVALKKANETKYWINLLHDSGFITISMYNFIFPRVEEIICIFSVIVKISEIKRK